MKLYAIYWKTNIDSVPLTIFADKFEITHGLLQFSKLIPGGAHNIILAINTDLITHISIPSELESSKLNK